MKKLAANLLIALVFMSGAAFAGDATFTWSKPVPAFGSPVPPTWVIDEYRIKCTVVVPGQPDVTYTRIVPGYDTETTTYDDLPNGDTTCHMTSWSNGAGTESVPSASVTKFVYDPGANPNPPTVFDFVPLVSMRDMPPVAMKSRTVITLTENGQKFKVRCHFRTSTKGNKISACGKPERI